MMGVTLGQETRLLAQKLRYGAALLAVLILAGCTPSGGSNGLSIYSGQSGDEPTQSADELDTLSGQVKVIYPHEAEGASGNYVQWLESIAAQTNLEFEFEEVSNTQLENYLAGSTGLDDNAVVLGFDQTQGDGEAFGDDYSCVIANQSWFEINQIQMPTSNAQLTEAHWANLLAIAAPDQSAQTAWWLMPTAAKSEDELGEYLSALKKSGAKLEDEAEAIWPGVTADPSANASTQSQYGVDTATTEARLVVDSALLPWRTVNNLGSSSEWAVLVDTCVQRELLAVGGDGERAQALVELIQAESSQLQMLQSGVAYPLDAEVVDEQVSLVAPRPEGAEIGAEDIAGLKQLINSVWEKL